jgi:Transglycosylase SLT domain
MTTSWRDGAAARTWIPVLNLAEDKYGIPRDLLARQCYEESRFNPGAKNPSGAMGIMQLLPKFFPGAGGSPLGDIDKGGAYLKHLYDGKSIGFGDWQLALAAYDWGPTALRKAMKKPGFGLESLPVETQNYVTQIIGDVPVPGALCKTPSLPQSPVAGFPVKKPSAELSSGSSPDSSLFSRLTSIFRRNPVQNSPLPSLGLSKPSVLTSFPPNQQEIPKMTSPVLTAAAPAIINALNAVKQFTADIGPDPAKWALMVPGALQKLLGTIEMQIPIVATAEAGALQSVVNAKVDELIAKLNAAVTPPPAAPSLVPGVAPAASQAV